MGGGAEGSRRGFGRTTLVVGGALICAVAVAVGVGVSGAWPRGAHEVSFEHPPRPGPLSGAVEGEDPGPGAGLTVTTPLEDPSGHALDHFHEALGRAEAGVGRARVLTYGASHAACDHVPGRLRSVLQARFGDGGRGFTLPAWPSDRYPYWTWGATVDEGTGWSRVRLNVDRGSPDYYGIAGIVFDSEGREAHAEIETADDGVGARADQVTVLYQAMPRGGRLEVTIDGTVVDTIDTSAAEVAAGYARYSVEDRGHEVALRALPGRPVRLYGLSFARGEAGVIVDNAAISGARARYHLRWQEPVYSEHLSTFAPDLLLLWYGGNESNDLDQPPAVTRREMGGAMDKLLRGAPEASCLVVGPLDKPLEVGGEWVHRQRTDDVIRVLRGLAFDHGCAYFDTAAFMGGPLSMIDWVHSDPPLARGDHVHLSALGYRLLADELAGHLLEGYPRGEAEAPAGVTSPSAAGGSAPTERRR